MKIISKQVQNLKSLRKKETVYMQVFGESVQKSTETVYTQVSENN